MSSSSSHIRSDGRVRSGGQANLSGEPPVSENANWKLANGMVLPPRHFLQKLGAVCPRGDLKCEPRTVRGPDGTVMCVVIGHLSCYFHSKGKKEGVPCGRWILTYFDASKPDNFRQWLIDEWGRAHNVAALSETQSQ